MSTCQVCGGRAHNAFLCRDHQAELRDTLAELPWWIDRLAEAAIGHTNLGDGGGRRIGIALTDYTDPATGDERLERDLVCGRLTLDRVLGAGGINAKAARALDDAQNTLSTILRGLLESRGVETAPHSNAAPRTGVAATVDLCRALSGHLSAISLSEDAGQTYGDIKRLRDDAERIVNRPVSRKFCGPCPTWLEDARKTCGVELWAHQDATEVFCRQCRATHNCNRLQLLLVNDLERSKVTVERILQLNRILPEEYRIPERTLRHWRRPGPNGEPPKLKPRGWQRPDGSHGITRHSDDDEPLYLWSDVRKLRTERGKAKAG